MYKTIISFCMGILLNPLILIFFIIFFFSSITTLEVVSSGNVYEQN